MKSLGKELSKNTIKGIVISVLISSKSKIKNGKKTFAVNKTSDGTGRCLRFKDTFMDSPNAISLSDVFMATNKEFPGVPLDKLGIFSFDELDSGKRVLIICQCN